MRAREDHRCPRRGGSGAAARAAAGAPGRRRRWFVGRWRRSAATRFVSAALVAALAATGCAKWDYVREPLPRVVPAENPTTIRLHTVHGRVITLRYPLVIGDEVVGFEPGSDSARARAVPLSEIRYAEVRRTDPVGTTFLVLFSGAVAGLIVVVAGTVDPGL